MYQQLKSAECERDHVPSIFPDWYRAFYSALSGGRFRTEANHHAMLFSYFDDSHDQRRQHYAASGGLIGHQNQWFTFNLRWLDATHELKKPFRSTECEGGHGQFHDDRANWPRPKREALMDTLVKIIRDYKLSGFASVVPIADYRTVFPGGEQLDPYYLSVQHTLINMAVLADRLRDRMEVWFENSTETSATSLDIYNKIRSLEGWSPATRLAQEVHFGSKSLCPLQAADLVAREALKHLLNRGAGQPARRHVLNMESRLIFIVWNRDTLTYLKENGGPENYDLLTNWGKTGGVPMMDVWYRNFGESA